MEPKTKNTVGEIVTHDFRAAAIFREYGIDYCCGGHMNIEEVCEKKKVNPEILYQQLNKLLDKPENQSNQFNKWNLDFLVDYIINKHHAYVLENIPFITELINKVYKVHGHYHTELSEVKRLFEFVADELQLHMNKEEKILFPITKQLWLNFQNKLNPSEMPFGSVKIPIQMMMLEHENAGEALRKIAELTENYSIPEGACNSYRVMLAKLNEFEEDLHQHVHLENNILFPKAIQLEKDLM